MKDIVVINIFNWPGDSAYMTIYRTLMNFLTTGQRIKKHVWNDLSSFFEKNFEQEACNPCERRHVQESLGDHRNILQGYNIEYRANKGWAVKRARPSKKV